MFAHCLKIQNAQDVTPQSKMVYRNRGKVSVGVIHRMGEKLEHGYEKHYSHLRGATVVMLLPARTDTRWFHEYIWNKAEIRFIKGRLKFGNSKNSAPFPSMVVIFQREDTAYDQDYSDKNE